VALGREGVRRPESVRESRRSTSESVVVFDSGLAAAGDFGRTPDSVSRRRFSTSACVAWAIRAAAADAGASRSTSSRMSEKMSEEVRADAPRTFVSPRGVLAATPVALSASAVACRSASSEKGLGSRSKAPTR
jgi:hypothetical protein